MRDRPERDDRGRFPKGTSGNPHGRRPPSPVAKLVAAAA